MQLGKFIVNISLQTEIKEQDNRQRTTVTAKGELFQNERQTVIRFTEKIDQQPDVGIMVTIKPEQVTIKRSGGVEMNQQFRLEQTTETIYRHPYGSIRLETLTSAIHYEPLTDKNSAELNIHYQTKLDGEEERSHKLLLMIEEAHS